MNNLVVINNNQIRVKEHKGQRIVSMWDISRAHQVRQDAVRDNFENNVQYMTEEKHYFRLDKHSTFAQDLILSGDITQNQLNAVKDIAIFTEKGYLMIVKPLQGEMAWKVQEEMIDRYFTVKEIIENLSPQLQVLIKMELEQSRMKQELEEARQQTAAVKQEVEDIKEIITINPKEDWRKQTNDIMAKICKKLNDYRNPKDELYKALEQRANCKLKIRLENLRGRVLKEGMTMSKANGLNYLDVISEDTKLKEIYIVIVKEIAIKNGITA